MNNPPLPPPPPPMNLFGSIFSKLAQCPLGSNKKTKKHLSLKIQIQRDFINIEQFSKNYPLQVPPSTPATLDLGPKSKICSHDFVCLIKCFPK